MTANESTPPNPKRIWVQLPVDFTQGHRQVIHHYFQGRDLSGGEAWSNLIKAMDILRLAKIEQGGRVETFAAIYDRLVDVIYADKLINELLIAQLPEEKGETHRAAIARQLMVDLRSAGLWQADTPESQLLVAFCLYWWQVFVRGYAFEIAIYQDLTASGIIYAAHDLRDRQDRFSVYDLVLLGFQGDIKTSTYFVQTKRSEALLHDFYITRMYHLRDRKWYQVVWLKPEFWHLLDGTPTAVAYDAIWQVLPGVAQITLRERSFVVVLYEEWKQRVVARQQEKKQNV